MRKITYILSIAALFVAAPTFANENNESAEADKTSNSQEKKIQLVDSKGRDVVSLSSDEWSSNGFLLNVAGLDFEFERKSRAIVMTGGISNKVVTKTTTVSNKGGWPESRFSLGGVKIAFIGLTNPDYSIYPAGTGDFFSLDNFKSTSVTVTAGVYSMPLERRGRLWIDFGLRLKWNNYVMSDPVKLVRENGVIWPQPIPDNMDRYKKSKLTTFALNVPLSLTVKIARKVNLNAGGYMDMVMRQHTKIKFPKHKDRGNYGANFFNFGLEGGIRVSSFSVFGSYSLSPLFRSGAGPKTNVFTVGFGWGL